MLALKNQTVFLQWDQDTEKFWKINDWHIIYFKPYIVVIYVFFTFVVSNFFADNSHGGHLSVFLHAVKAPFDISVIFSLYTIFSPTSLGSLSGFKNSLFKLIWILSPVS